MLSGERAANPLIPGQTISAHGLFDDGAETGLGVFVVLRASGRKHHYEVAPLGCTDRYWSKHIGDAPSTRVKVISRHGETVMKDVDQLTRWRILAEAGKSPLLADLALLGKPGAEKAHRKWKFLADYMVSDQQAGSDPPFHGNLI